LVRHLLRLRLLQGPASQRILRQPDLRRLRVLRALPLPQAPPQLRLIRLRIRLLQLLPQQSLRHLRPPHQLQQQPHDRESHLHRPDRGLEFLCGLRARLEPFHREHDLLRRLLELRALPARRQTCNAIQLVQADLRQDRDKCVPARRKECVRRERRNNIARVVRRRVVPVARLVNAPVDRRRVSHLAPAGVVPVDATIKRLSARNAPALEFRRPNRASRFMHASPPHEAGRSSKSATPKVSASCIQFVRVRE
jgi:hypothetical protein